MEAKLNGTKIRSKSKVKRKCSTPEEAAVQMEKSLLETFRSVLFLNQLTGYFPLTFDPKFGIVNAGLGLPFIWSAVLILCGITGGALTVLFIGLDTSPLLKVLFTTDFNLFPKTSSHEKWIYVIMTGVAVSFSLWFKINAAKTRVATIRFWEENCKTFEEFKELSILPSKAVDSELTFHVEDEDTVAAARLWMKQLAAILNRYLRLGRFCAFLGFCATFGLATDYLVEISDLFSNNYTEFSFVIFVTLLLAIQYFFVFFLHFSQALYITLFLRAYRSCFVHIGEYLNKISQSKRKGLQRVESQPLIQSRSEVQNLVGSTTTVYISTGERNENVLEKNIERCIRAYNLVEKLIEDFNDHFKWEILIEIIYSILMILGFGLLTTIWARQGEYIFAVGALVPIIAFTYQLLLLASHASWLNVESEQIGKYFLSIDLEQFPHHFQNKILMMSNKIMSGSPLILPGSFFKLDRYLSTLILTAILLFLAAVSVIQYNKIDQGWKSRQDCQCNCNCSM